MVRPKQRQRYMDGTAQEYAQSGTPTTHELVVRGCWIHALDLRSSESVGQKYDIIFELLADRLYSSRCM